MKLAFIRYLLKVNTTFQLRTIFSLAISFGVWYSGLLSQQFRNITSWKFHFADSLIVSRLLMNVIDGCDLFFGRLKADLENFLLLFPLQEKWVTLVHGRVIVSCLTKISI